MRKIKVGMLGIGNIGKGTYRTLEMGRKKIEDTTGLSIEIVKILNRHPDRDRGIDIPGRNMSPTPTISSMIRISIS